MSVNTSDAPSRLSMGAFATVFQAVEGLRNRSAALAMLGCFVVGVLVAGLGSALGAVGGALGSLLFLVAVATGVNAAGTLQMDHARGVTPRSISDALVYGLLCIPKLIALGLLLLLVAIAVFIVMAVLLLLCKIPFLGPVLYVVVFPLSVLVCGVTLAGLFVCMLLSLPAIWEGLGILRAVAQTLAIARSRLVEALLLLFALALLAAVVGILVFWILGAGLMPTLGLSLRILGGGGGADGYAMGPLGMLGGIGGGHALAAIIGFGILWAAMAAVVGQVNLLGLAIVYLRVTAGLDVGATEAALARGFDDARRRTAELGEKARAAAERGRAAAAGAAGAGGAAGATNGGRPGEPPPTGNPYELPTNPGYAGPPSEGQASPGGYGSMGGDSFTAPAAHGRGAAYPVPPPPGTAYPAPPPPAAPATPYPPATPWPAPAAAWPPAPAPGYGAPPAVQAPPPMGSAPGQPPAQTIHCPSCAAECSVEDVFCGVCGQRLR